ncbi:MAG TPA: ATP-dependent DNA helicase, partial [Phenylobacterium sp.]|nr:ATP-dependent DNA helicase [Phenylobacterium sp.]
ILVLTYSNKAAGELSDRIAVQRPDAAAAMFIGTFHAFGLDLVRRFHAELGFAQPPRMMDRPEAIELLEAEFTRLGLVHYRNLWDPSQLLRDLLGAMSRAQDELVAPQRYAELAEAMAQTATNAAEQEAAARAAEVAKVYAAYEAIKAKASAIDFGDLVTLPVKLLSERPDIASQLRDTYRHVLVDEYQDVNRASVRLLQLLTDKGQNLWAVGDARQSIYRFRGASSFNMARFKTADFPDAGGSRLEINYRSAKEIVDAYSAFGRDMVSETGRADLHAERGACGQTPSHVQFPTGDDEAGALAAVVREVQVDRRAWRDQAVLCKGNERLARLGEALERAGIPVLFLGSLFERPEIKDLLAWLSLLIDRRAMGLARRKAAGLDAPLSDVAALLAHLKSAETSLTWLNPTDGPDLSPDGTAAVTQMAALLDGFASNAAPWDVLARLLLDRTRIAADIAAADDVASRARGLAIWQFMNFVRVQKAAAGLPIQRLLERIRRLVLLADDRDLRQLPLAAQEIDAVRLMTVHGSKGLEFPVVHLLGLNNNAFPRNGGPPPPCPPPVGLIEGAVGSGRDVVSASEAEEQECLFYVALSRARDRLFLYSAQATANGSRRDPSPFLARLGPLQLRRVAPAASAPDDDATPIPVRFAGPLSFTDVQIALFERCPRRFFYTHILEVGGRRTTTAFMGLHDVVQATVKILAARPPEEVDDAVVAEIFTTLFDSHDVAGHGYSADFRAIGTTLVGYFADQRRGRRSIAPEPLRLVVVGGEIVVTPDEILVDETGHAVRSIRSGHLSASQRDNLGAAAFQLAAQDAFPGCRVELVHLADNTQTALDLTPRKLTTRRAKVEAAMADIAAGRFPMRESPFTCPRCPAFFICGPVVEGAFEKKF